MVQLERRVEILQEEKSVLTSMERRLQERCAELQRDVFRLQNMYNSDNYGTLDKRPVALPRQAGQPQATKSGGSSVPEDEGISSSDTNHSLSSESESMLVVKIGGHAKNNNKASRIYHSDGNSVTTTPTDDYTINDDETVRIEDVIEELENVVNVQSRELDGYSAASTTDNNVDSNIGQMHDRNDYRKEKDIVPVNLLPQPPKRSRSLVHLLSSGSEFDGSEYGMLLLPQDTARSFCNDITSTDMKIEKYGHEYGGGSGGSGADSPDHGNSTTTNRELLDEIMDAQEKELSLPPFITGERRKEQINPLLPYLEGAPQKFDGVFFMSDLGAGAARKYSKSDLVANAIDAKRSNNNASKLNERIDTFENGGIDSVIDIVVTHDGNASIPKLRRPFDAGKVLSTFGPNSGANMGSTFFIGSKALSADAMANKSLRSMGSKLSDLPSGLY